MADTPIPKQKGLSQEELDSMKTPKQEFSEDSPSSLILTPQTGTQAQQLNISSNLHKILVDHEKRLQKLDSKDEYANYKELEILADDLATFVIDVIKTQMVIVTTTVSTDDTVSGTQTTTTTPPVVTPMVLSGTKTGTGTGNATPAQVVIT